MFLGEKHSYSFSSHRGYPSGNMPPNNATGQDMYNRYTSSQQGPTNYPTGTPPNARSNSYPSGPQTHPVTVQQQTATSQPSSPSQPPTVSSYSCPQDYYRQEQVILDVFILIIFDKMIKLIIFHIYHCIAECIWSARWNSNIYRKRIG